MTFSDRKTTSTTLGFGQNLFKRPVQGSAFVDDGRFPTMTKYVFTYVVMTHIANSRPAVLTFTNNPRRWVLNRAEINKKNRLKIHWNWISRSSWNDWIGIHVYWIGKRSYRQLNNLCTVTNHWLYEIELSSIDSCNACFENSGRRFRKNPSRAVQTNQLTTWTPMPALLLVWALYSCARDEEPLVVYSIDGGWGKFFASLYVTGARFFSIGRVVDTDIGAIVVWVAFCCKVNWNTYREIPPRWVLPRINLSQASAHSRTMSVAYLNSAV